MKRIFLFCLGLVLGAMAMPILWCSPQFYGLNNSWHSVAFTRVVGMGGIVEGVLIALGAALCFGRAINPLNLSPDDNGETVPKATGGPVLPICGLFFLLAAMGPFSDASRDAGTLEVMASMPGNFGGELVADFQLRERTERVFAILWLVIGVALLGSPWFLKPRVWRLGWRTNGIGWGIVIGGVLASAFGALLCVANGLAMEGASPELSRIGLLIVLAGSIIAVLGGLVAVRGVRKQ